MMMAVDVLHIPLLADKIVGGSCNLLAPLACRAMLSASLRPPSGTPTEFARGLVAEWSACGCAPSALIRACAFPVDQSSAWLRISGGPRPAEELAANALLEQLVVDVLALLDGPDLLGPEDLEAAMLVAARNGNGGALAGLLGWKKKTESGCVSVVPKGWKKTETILNVAVASGSVLAAKMMLDHVHESFEESEEGRMLLLRMSTSAILAGAAHSRPMLDTVVAHIRSLEPEHFSDMCVDCANNLAVRRDNASLLRNLIEGGHVAVDESLVINSVIHGSAACLRTVLSLPRVVSRHVVPQLSSLQLALDVLIFRKANDDRLEQLLLFWERLDVRNMQRAVRSRLRQLRAQLAAREPKSSSSVVVGQHTIDLLARLAWARAGRSATN